MMKQILTLAGLSIVTGLMLVSMPDTVTAQQQPAKAPSAVTAPAAKPAAPAAKPTGPAYKQPLTSWGEPDISGMWPINHLVTTPLQRDVKYGDRAYLTDNEFKAAQTRADAQKKQRASGALPSSESGAAIRQTSLIVDPPNGRFPA